MKRRTFCQAAGLTAGSLFVPSFLAHGAAFFDDSADPITFSLQVATSPDFAPANLLLDARDLLEPSFVLDRLDATESYFWRVRASKGDKTTNWSRTARFSTGNAVGVEESETPLKFDLGANYPNPFNPVTTIPFTLPEGGPATLRVYNELGQELATLVDEYRPAGTHAVQWEAGSFSSGRYFYVLRAGSFQQSRTMVLLK